MDTAASATTIWLDCSNDTGSSSHIPAPATHKPDHPLGAAQSISLVFPPPLPASTVSLELARCRLPLNAFVTCYRARGLSDGQPLR